MHLAAEKLAARRGDDLIFVDISFYLTGGEALVLTGRNGHAFGPHQLPCDASFLAGFLAAVPVACRASGSLGAVQRQANFE